MRRERLKLGQLLVGKRIVDPEQLLAALAEQTRWGSRLGATLVRMGFVDEEKLVRVLASQLRLPVARIRAKTVSPEVIELVPVALAEKYRCLPLFVRQEGGAPVLFVGMEDPGDLEALDELAFQLGQKLRPVLVAPSDLEDALRRHYHGSASISAGALTGAEDPAKAETAPDLTAAALFDAPVADPRPERTTEPVAPSQQPGARAAAPPGALPSDVALRALSELLVEKGVLGREELAERIRRLNGAPRA